MQHPLFHVINENEKGTTLAYKSVRHGLAYFSIGSLKAIASVLFNEKNIDVIIQHDLSIDDYSHVVFWISFDNKRYDETKRMFSFPSLPGLSYSTFFQVFPFSILMDSSLNIHRMGEHIMKVFSRDAHWIGRPLDEVFRLIRPDIDVEWDKIVSYSRHIVFLIENRLPLRVGSSGEIRLKGQMKYIENIEICSGSYVIQCECNDLFSRTRKRKEKFDIVYRLESANDMTSTGLHLTDLNVFDSTRDMLITGIHQERELEGTIHKQHLLTKKAPNIRKKLSVYHKKNQGLLDSTMPKHITLLLKSGVQAKSICECQPLVTIMFAHVMDLKTLADHLDAAHAITCLNKAIILFDSIADKFDVFKVEIKADASYMIVAGIHDQTYMVEEQNGSETSSVMTIIEEDNEVDLDNDNDNIEEEKCSKNPFGHNSTEIIAALSLELLNASKHVHNPITNKPFELKFGFHSSTAIGGIIGIRNYQYCLFGDTVKIASQITTTGEIGRIHLSQTAYTHLITDKRFIIEHRGQIELKSKYPIETYWLIDLIEKPSTTSINKNTTILKCPFPGHDWTVK